MRIAPLAPIILLLLALLVPSAARALSHEDTHATTLAPQTLLHASPVTLVDPVQQRRARAISDYHQGLFFGWALAPIVAFFVLWQSGNAARLRDFLRRRFRTAWVVRAAFGAVLGSLAMIAALPFAFADYRIAANVRVTLQPIPSWFAGEIVRIGIVALASALAVAVVLELVDRTRLWYLAFIGFLYVFALGAVALEPVLYAPLASHDRPAPAPIVALGDAVAHALGVSPVSIMIATEPSRTGLIAARTSGLRAFTRILLDADALARTTPAEHRYILARQYAHVRRHDVLWLALGGTTLFVIAGALAVLVSDRVGFRRDDDPLSRLALVGTCLGVAVLCLLPVDNALERSIEWQADRAALAVTNDPATAVRILVRTADDNLTPLCGRRSTRWYFDSRLPVGTRIAQITGQPDPCPR